MATTRKTPKDVPGSMPSNTLFPTIAKMATGLTPNPANKVVGAWHGVTPPRFEGDFSPGRSESQRKYNLWKPTTRNTSKKV